MAQCPSCGSDVDEDFGLVNCQSCGAVLVVEMDGSVRSADSEASPPGPAVGATSPSIELSSELSAELAEEIVGEEDLQPPQAEPNEFEEPDFIDDSEPQPVDPEFESSDPQDFRDQVNPPSVLPTPSSGSGELSDIVDFANSEASSGQSGLLQVNIRISGIDAKDTRQSLRDILDDDKFFWNVDELMNSIINGRLEIEDVPAVKAAVLISQLKPLPFQVEWDQHAIIEA